MNIVVGVIRKIGIYIDSIAFGLIDNAYDLINSFAKASLVNEPAFEKVRNNVYIVIGVFALFRLALLLINSIIDPDKLTEKGKGIGNVLSNIIITFVLLIVTPLIFTEALELQKTIVEGNYIQKIFSQNENEIDTEKSGYNAGDTMRSIAIGSLITLNTEMVDEDYNIKSGVSCSGECSKAIEDYKRMADANDFKFTTLANHIGQTGKVRVEDEKGNVVVEEEYVYDYTLFLTFAAGCFITYVLFSFAIDIAVRLVELTVLEVISPLFIVTYIDPNSAKSGPFNKFLKAVGKTYFSLFIKLAIISLMLLLMGVLKDFNPEGAGKFGKLIIYIAILIFAKKAPKWIGDMLGVDLNESGLSIGKKLGGAALVGGGIAAAQKFGTQKAKNFAANRLRNTTARAAGMVQAGRDRHNLKKEIGNKEGYKKAKEGTPGIWAAGRAAAKQTKANNYGADSQGFIKDIGAGLAAGRLAVNPDQKSIKENLQANADVKAQVYKDKHGLSEDAMRARAKTAEAARIHKDGVKFEEGKRIEESSFQSKDEFVLAASSNKGTFRSAEDGLASALKAKGLIGKNATVTLDSSGRVTQIIDGDRTIDANGFKNMVNTNISEYGQKLISSWTAQQQQTQNSSMVAGINSYNEAAKRVTDLQVQLSNIPKTNTEARNAVQLQIDSAKNSMLRIKESTDAVITKTVEMESSYNGTADPSKCPGAVFDAATGNFVTTLGKFVRQDDGTYNYETNGTPETENVTIPKEQAQIQQRFADDVTKAKDSADKEKEKLSGTSGKK